MRATAVAVTIAVIALVACTSDPSCGCAIDPQSFEEDWLRQAATVVIADIVEDGSSKGAVAIRPVATLRGSLAVDADGLHRFAWRKLRRTGRGLWLFDASGAPIWDAADKTAAPLLPEYPWGSYDVEFLLPDEVAAEERRVVAAADLVVEVATKKADQPLTPGTRTVTVLGVLQGDGTVSAGDHLTFTYVATAELWYVLEKESQVVALQRMGDEWVATPTWLTVGWGCGLDGPSTHADLFPDYRCVAT